MTIGGKTFVLGNHNRVLTIIMLLQCLSSASRVVAFAPASRSIVRRVPSSVMWYSASTMKRIEGKSQPQELAKMADTMNMNSEELQDVLKERLHGMDSKSEKAEYIDWLLAPSPLREDTSKVASKKAAPTPTTATKYKAPAHGDSQVFSTNVMFADRADLHPLSKRAITEVMQLTSMTEIQEKTFVAASSGRDVLGRARTGTGKTLAFLLPAIEQILQNDDYIIGETVGIVVISPTRELAIQIADQAEKLLSFHEGMHVQVAYGGTKVESDLRKMSRRLPTILVATPGRLTDLMENGKVNNKRFGKDIMSRTPLVVLDETDRLLDMGFRDAIMNIFRFLPPQKHRQTLLFSATMPPALKHIMEANMKSDFIEVDCINDGDAASHTNSQVQQSHVVVPFNDRFVSSVAEVVCQAMQDDPKNMKIVVFFPTARMVNFFAEMFTVGLNIPVIELHSKKSQGYRNRVSKEFREASTGVLFTSDVSARGVDYPNVSHVIQFGVPDNRESYIHRLGRTGRAGTEGKGWLVISDFESMFLNELRGLDIPVEERLREMFQKPVAPDLAAKLAVVHKRIATKDKVLASSAEGAYQAFLGYYKGQVKRLKMRGNEKLVQLANQFATLTGLKEIPAISPMLASKMGLKNVEGLNLSGKGELRPKTKERHLTGRNGPEGPRRLAAQGGGGNSSRRDSGDDRTRSFNHVDERRRSFSDGDARRRSTGGGDGDERRRSTGGDERRRSTGGGGAGERQRSYGGKGGSNFKRR